MLTKLPTGELIGTATNLTDDFDDRAALEPPVLGRVNAYTSASDIPSTDLFPPINPDKTIAVLHKDTGKVVIYYPQGSSWVEIANETSRGLTPNFVADGATATVNEIAIAANPSTLIAPAPTALGRYATAKQTTNGYGELREFIGSADGSKWLELEKEIESNSIFFQADVSLYCSNSWTARNFGTIGNGISSPDAASHYKVNRSMTLELDAAATTSEGPGMTIGVAWQIYRSGNWINPSTVGNSRVWSGGAGYLNDSEVIQFRSGEWLRLLTLASDGGRNSYPGNRTFRISIIERTKP